MAVDKKITGVKENVSVIKEEDLNMDVENVEDGDVVKRLKADEEIEVEETDDGGAVSSNGGSSPYQFTYFINSSTNIIIFICKIYNSSNTSFHSSTTHFTVFI